MSDHLVGGVTAAMLAAIQRLEDAAEKVTRAAEGVRNPQYRVTMGSQVLTVLAIRHFQGIIEINVQPVDTGNVYEAEQKRLPLPRVKLPPRVLPDDEYPSLQELLPRE